MVARGPPPAPSVVVACGGVGPPSPPWLGFAPPPRAVPPPSRFLGGGCFCGGRAAQSRAVASPCSAPPLASRAPLFSCGGVVAARLGFWYRQTMCDKIVPTYDGGTTWERRGNDAERGRGAPLVARLCVVVRRAPARGVVVCACRRCSAPCSLAPALRARGAPRPRSLKCRPQDFFASGWI